MSRSKSRGNWIVVSGLSLAIGVVACGKSDPIPPATTPVPGGQPVVTTPGACGSGAYTFTQSNCLMDFVSACNRAGGIASQKTCAFPVNALVTSTSGVLNPSNPSGPLAGTGIVVRPGDLLAFTGTGKWGTIETSQGSFFFDLFNYSWTSYDCDKVDLNGYADGKLGKNESVAAGLIGAVAGTSEVFVVGKVLSIYEIKNAGVLHVGVNAPTGMAGLCGGYSGTMYVTVK